MTAQAYFKTRLRSKGQITVPIKIRELLKAIEGDELIFRLNEQNQVVLECVPTIDLDQAWFWTERWQQMEREADEDLRAGCVVHFPNVEEAIAYLDQEEEEETEADFLVSRLTVL